MENEREKYRAVLLSPLGMEVLSDILKTCHFGGTLDPENKAQVSEHNVGIVVLAKLGIFAPDTLYGVVMALSSVAPTIKHKEVEE